MLYSKDDLTHKDYEWEKPPGKVVYSGSPTRRAFDPFNGEQVLFVINTFCTSITGITIAEVEKIESLLRDKLPLGPRSEISVVRWLELIYE
ncbi:hypothetical protein [Dinghuibacter silviterrae]|uniref:Uncharacterized protein n=1 Tax=Dinghuibacter silviterrae TaxID=1539049 RepID=A0A4R8DT48_9BACT|nr:hypothetical protein [Dinghuibacter silviterrae]TDX01454.1 hypothetical protein EDB95_2489 [Dinghuibacter silviterrae]